MKINRNGKEKEIQSIAVLTGGGDCAGHNAVLTALVRGTSMENERSRHDPNYKPLKLTGLLEGWKALSPLAEVNKITKTLHLSEIEHSFRSAGTIIRSSRVNLFSKEGIEGNWPNHAIDVLKKLEIDVLVCLGGDDTLGAASKFYDQFGIPTLGAAKTMDNDVPGTDLTYGFSSAVDEVRHVLDNLRTTAESHGRCFIVEAFGRHAGWVALHAGVASGAEIILLPEEVVNIKTVITQVNKSMKTKGHCILVAAEGTRLFHSDYPQEINNGNRSMLVDVTKDPKYALIKARHEMPKKTDAFGNEILGGISEYIKAILEKNTIHEYRIQNCGHAIRGGIANATDRLLGLRFGDAIFNYIKDGNFGVFPGLNGNKIIPVPLKTAVGGGRFVPSDNDLFRMRNSIDYY